MNSSLRAETLSVAEVEFLGRVYDSGKADGVHMKGYDLRRARERMVPMGMVEQGRLDNRHFKLTPKGTDFVEGLRRSPGLSFKRLSPQAFRPSNSAEAASS